MLTKLNIKNYALIESLEMIPAKRLTVITGETGAGKSIMVGAVGLLLGKRADIKALYNLDNKCIIEGSFNISEHNLQSIFDKEDLDYDDETVIRREITPSGKSRSFINDSPVKLEVLRKIGNFLMDVHSQNETLQLGASDFQLFLIDSYANNQNLLSEFAMLYANFKAKQKAYKLLLDEGETLKKNADYNAYLLAELAELNLEAKEQEQLENELKLLENVEEIKLKLNEVIASLNDSELGALDKLQSVRSSLSQLSIFGRKFEILNEQFEQAFIELKEIANDIENEENQLDVDFERTEQVQQRLSNIYQLQTKHKVSTIIALIEIQKELELKTFAAEHLEDALAKAKTESKVAEEKALLKASVLSAKRLKSLEVFSNSIKKLLANVGMPNASILVDLTEKPLSISGSDEINILFSANKGLPPQPLKQVASGGEFSRLMFCIKYLLADKAALPTIVFDEIDTGISGEIALKMGAMMREMAKNHQVIVISHLPQIAAKGDVHYYIYKDNSSLRATSKIQALNQEQHVKAIARMIGGDTPTESAYISARELMEL